MFSRIQANRLFVLMLMMVVVGMLTVLQVSVVAAAVDQVALATDYGGILADFLSTVIFPLIGAILLGLVGVVLNKIRQKWNLNISQQNEEIIDDLVKKGLAFAEEKAAAAIKAGVTKYTGNQKADEAIAFVLSQAPHLPIATIEAKVTSWLGLTVGVGATGNHALGGYRISDEQKVADAA